jgi:hypothetical protein
VRELSRKNNSDTLNVQFKVKKGTEDGNTIKEIEEIYKSEFRSDNIKRALRDLLILYKTFEVKRFSELINGLVQLKNRDDNNYRKQNKKGASTS